MPNLTFKQKREYQAQLESKYAELEAGSLSFKEKRTIQAQIADIYTLLGEDGTEPATAPATELALFQRLIAGEFNNLPMQQYLDKGFEAAREFAGLDFDEDPELCKECATVLAEYMAAHRTEITNPAGLKLTQQDIDEEAA